MRRQKFRAPRSGAVERRARHLRGKQVVLVTAWSCLIATSTQPMPEEFAAVLHLPVSFLSFASDCLKYLSMSALFLLGQAAGWRHMWPSVGFVVLMALSVPLSVSPLHSATVVAMLLVTLLVSMKAGASLDKGYLVGGAIVGLLLVLVPSLFILRESIFAPVTGIFGTRNELARISTYCAILGFAGVWTSKHRTAKALSFSSFIFSSALSVYTESATALITLIVFLVVFLAVRSVGWPPGRFAVPSLLFLAAISILVSPLVYGHFFALTGRDLSFTGRTDIWEFAWVSVSERPLSGYGAEAFWASEGGREGRTMLGDAAVHSHNTWIELFLSLGIVGGSLAIAALALQVILVIRKTPSAGMDLTALSLFLGLTMVTALYGFSEHAAYRPFYSLVYAYLALSVYLMSPKR